MTRRAFLRTAAGLLVAAPAIVRAESIMPVRRRLLTCDQVTREALQLLEPRMPLDLVHGWFVHGEDAPPITAIPGARPGEWLQTVVRQPRQTMLLRSRESAVTWVRRGSENA